MLNRGVLENKYRKALAKSYFYLARNLIKWEQQTARDLVRHASTLDANFKPNQSRLYDLLFATFGFKVAEIAARWKKRVSP